LKLALEPALKPAPATGRQPGYTDLIGRRRAGRHSGQRIDASNPGQHGEGMKWATGGAPRRHGPSPWLALGAVLVLAACASPPAPLPPGPPGHALAPRADTAFAPIESGLVARHGPSSSGFLPLRDSLEALRWRLVMIDAARHSLDLQYYVWFGDKVGQLLMARVVAAADRGVRVRLLVDDLSTLLHDMTHLELRDAMLRRLDGHPRIEIRVFNAWQQREVLGRFIEGSADFERLNHRMHNKQMVADNQAVIIGGRNIGDEYFGLNTDFNFLDLDVLAVGPAARQASRVFDRYWNSPRVRPLPRDTGPQAGGEPSSADQQALAALMADPRARRVLAGLQAWDTELAQLPRQLQPGTGRVLADAPLLDGEQAHATPVAVHELLRSARREVLITNAYVIPDARLLEDFRRLAARGVRVRLLTNSLASHDVPAVNSHYEGWRRPLLEAGVELHELRPDAAVQRDTVEIAPVRSEFTGLHTKSMVVDGRWSFIGSMNMDPRSETLNAEMGIVIDSEPLANALKAQAERDLSGANSWRLGTGAQGELTWVSDAGTLTRQPARSLWQRVQNLFFKLLPPQLY
jgi:putative cardiolipin synthase